jgi:hypothetical protein
LVRAVLLDKMAYKPVRVVVLHWVLLQSLQAAVMVVVVAQQQIMVAQAVQGAAVQETITAQAVQEQVDKVMPVEME